MYASSALNMGSVANNFKNSNVVNPISTSGAISPNNRGAIR